MHRPHIGDKALDGRHRLRYFDGNIFMWEVFSLTHIGRHFRLSEERGIGVSCDGNGVFVGAVPLLESVCSTDKIQHHWRSRPASTLNRDLSACYGLPIEFEQKIHDLVAVTQALSRGDMMHAQIATLHLEIPDPPALAKSTRTRAEILDLARQLRSGGMLKADWDPAKHPRWPAGSPGGVGGEFAPAGTASAEQSANEGSGADPDVSIIPAQLTLPVPFDFPIPPLPSEILPPPAIPEIYPRELSNPYPDRAGCDEEWADAIAYCKGLLERNQLGRRDYRGSGKSLYQCIMGRVSERCSGNSTGA